MKVPCLLFRIRICWKMYRHISSVPISIPYFIIQKKIHPLRLVARRQGKSVICTRTFSITLISNYKNASLFGTCTYPGHPVTRTTKSCRVIPNILHVIITFCYKFVQKCVTDNLQTAKAPYGSDIHKSLQSSGSPVWHMVQALWKQNLEVAHRFLENYGSCSYCCLHCWIYM